LNGMATSAAPMAILSYS